MRRRLVLELDVETDGDSLPTAADVATGIAEGLPDEWWDPQDGDDFWLGDRWTYRYVGEVSP